MILKEKESRQTTLVAVLFCKKVQNQCWFKERRKGRKIPWTCWSDRLERSTMFRNVGRDTNLSLSYLDPIVGLQKIDRWHNT